MDEKLLHRCLFFTTNSLARKLNRMAESRFASINMCASSAFLMLCVIEEPGINPASVAAVLDLAPSTVTRFADGLERDGLLTRTRSGKTSALYPTQAGKEMRQRIMDCWLGLYSDMSDKIGKERADSLALEIDEASSKL